MFLPSDLRRQQSTASMCTIQLWGLTHMGRVQDMVTGLLNGSSSMNPLFFKSRGVGLAVENRGQTVNRKQLSSDKLDLNPKMAIKKQKQGDVCCQTLTFPVWFEVAVDGWGCDIAETPRSVTQGGAAPLTGR